MRQLGLRITFEIILGAVLVASLVIILRQSRQLADFQRHKETDAQSLRLLQQALRQKGLHELPPPVTEGIPPGGDHAGAAKREAIIERLDRELAEARTTITDLQSQLSKAIDQNSKALAGAEEHLRKQQADSQAQLEDLQRKLDGALADSQIARQRVAALEADNSRLHAEATAHATDYSRTVASLQDLNRRREICLTSIQRRYRDITSEFRAMSSMLDTSRDQNSNVCSGEVLSRIQNAVALADDDMRQLNELDARAQKLEKQIQKK
jgi:predicted  nucleic acid-binding Zn-ribbon protein